jgi:pyruvate,water dikinase
MAVTSAGEEVLGSFHGSDEFPIAWEEGEQELFWIYDDLHCPNPVSPMFFDIGGWWLTCDHMFRRFGTPFACDWIAKEINGYVYTAAVPADSRIRSEATEYQSRYVPRVPRDPGHAGRIGAYLGWVLPHYAENFLDWWRDRLRPEIERNFEYLDEFDTGAAGFIELAVLLEDAIDIHDRHWKIHWMLNFAQFASTQALNGLLEEAKGEAAAGLMGRLQSSVEDRNWDSIEDLWKMKEEIRADAELAGAFEAETADQIMGALAGSERGRRFIEERVEPHQKAFGYKAIWSHEFAFTTWREDPAPMIEAVRGYLATDYDYPSNIAAVRADLEAAVAEALDGVEGGDLKAALDRSLSMNPLTPDHHFYIDQGTNARLRLVLIAIGEKLVEAGTLDDPEDVMYLRYNELRLLMADAGSLDAREVVGDRRDARQDAFEKRPPSWVGTATQTALDFPYNALWGFPEKFHAGEPATTGEVKGLAASPGVVEGPARYVTSLDEFDQVRSGEILVCRMTNPAWVVLFTKISGLVTEAGGVVSHPAVVAREFGIPAVVGTTNAGDRIATGDRVRVNGTTGVVELLGPAQPA